MMTIIMIILFFRMQDPSGSCLDRCCSTSNPCLNNGTCQATCMKNGHRFTCHNCADGFDGNRCENPPRSCAAFSNPPNLGEHYKIIYAPDNTPYQVICFFTSTNVQTLVMSFTRINSPHMTSHSLAQDNPVNENNPNWVDYRLSLARMKSIRDSSYQWFYTCQFDVRSWSWDNYLQSEFEQTDPLTYDSSTTESDCRLVSSVNVRGKSCSSQNCKVGMTQTTGTILRVDNSNVNCGGLGVGMYTCSANGVPVTYFGDYTCYISTHKCSQNNQATTQLWFSN